MSVNDISLLYPSSKFSPFKLQFFTVLIVSLPSLAAPVVKAEDLEISSSPSRDRRQALVSRDNEDLVDARSNFIVDPSSQGCKSSASSSSDGEGSASASASSSSQDQDCNADASANSSNGANEEDSPAPVDNESSSSNSTPALRTSSSQVDLSTATETSPSSLISTNSEVTTIIIPPSLVSGPVTSTSLLISKESSPTASTLIPTVTSAASSTNSSPNIPTIVVGSVLGSVFGVLAILGICVGIWCCRRRRRLRRRLERPISFIPSALPLGLGRSGENDSGGIRPNSTFRDEKRLRSETMVSPATESEPTAMFESRRFVIDRRDAFGGGREEGREVHRQSSTSGVGSESPPEYSA